MLNFETEARLSNDADVELLLRNFWEPEKGFAWSTGRWCEINFAFDPGAKPYSGHVDLMLDIDAYRFPGKLEGQNLLFYLNGYRIGSNYCLNRATVILLFDGAILRRSENLLTIDTPDSCRPSDFGSADKRILGAQVFSLRFRKVD